MKTCATVMWSLEAQTEWCAGAFGVRGPFSAEICAQTDGEIGLTTIIDQKRAGPNKNGQCTVGATTESADVVLSVDTVSTSHAVFDEDEDGNLFVTDCLSTNGTFVNGKQIASNQKVKLSPGDSLAFGPEPVFIVLRNVFAHA